MLLPKIKRKTFAAHAAEVFSEKEKSESFRKFRIENRAKMCYSILCVDFNFTERKEHEMKRVLAFVLALMVLLSVVGCSPRR